MTERVPCIVIGAGVVGLAVGMRLAQYGLAPIVLERHDLIGSETSSRNSEVIHAGIYYPQGSLKAGLCVQGKAQLYAHCAEYGVPFERCGKLIVATDASQVETVQAYIKKGAANGVDDLRWLDADAARDIEPAVHSVGGVWSPSTGIIDSHAYMLSLQGALEQHGGTVVLQTDVESLVQEGPTIRVRTAQMELLADWVVNSGGLGAGRVGSGLLTDSGSYYAKGHYYAYSGTAPFRGLVYPMAQPGGLGVHVTKDLGGQVKFGPDVQWIDREDYTFDTANFVAFVRAIRAYYPDLDVTRLHPSYTGIRPKIAPQDVAFSDFVIDGPRQHGVQGFVNLRGIESPGLTASLAIADYVAAIMGAA